MAAGAIDHHRSAGQACRRPRAQAPDVHAPLVTSNKPQPDPASADFDRSLAELEAIVEKLEQGDLSLDESLRQFERGVQLTRACQSALKTAEQKVEILLRRANAAGAADTESGDEFAPAPFEPDTDGNP